MYFEIRMNKSETQVSVHGKYNLNYRDLYEKDVYENKMYVIASFECDTWEEAMAVRYDILDF